MRIVVFAGSLRRDSLNKKFAKAAVSLAKDAGHEAEFLDLKDYALPLYDGDIEAAGMPENATALSQKIASADALIVASPEYNGSIASPLKNAIDWLSRIKPVSLTDKPLLLLSASPGALGGVRGLWHTRVPFEALGVHVFPGMMGLPGADKLFDEKSELQEDKRDQLQKLLAQFLAHVKA